jgi:hypothetical protein
MLWRRSAASGVRRRRAADHGCLADAPGDSFTACGHVLRYATVAGLQATTAIAAATQIDLRYVGKIAKGTDNHALNIDVPVSW